MQDTLTHIPGAIVIAALLYAAWTDLATRIIPNGACVAIALAGLSGRLGDGPVAVGWSVATAAGLFCLLVVLHSRGAIGGGDVKLLSALSLGLAPTGSLQLLIYTALAGGLLGMVHLALRLLPDPTPCGASAPLLRRVGTIERWRIRRHGSLPYGVAIACGGLWVLSSNLGS